MESISGLSVCMFSNRKLESLFDFFMPFFAIFLYVYVSATACTLYNCAILIHEAEIKELNRNVAVV